VKSSTPLFAVALSLLLLSGCASVPTGPSVMALPGAGKNFNEFRSDDAECRDFAQRQVGGASADGAAIDAGVRSAAVGTLVGAVAGAAIGGHEGAGVGAGTGLLFGSMAGTGAAQSSAYGTQRNYDHAYIQCMYAKGEQVPGSLSMTRHRIQPPVAEVPVAPTTVFYPPPPPGTAPPPKVYAPPPSGYAPPPPGYQPPPPPESIIR